MTYSQIPIILKRFSFDSKMSICQSYCRSLMKYNRLDILSNKSIILPWELEVFALFSIMSTNEYQNYTFSEKRIKTFYDIINAIRNYEDPILFQNKDSIEFVYRFLMSTGQLQFKYQADIRIRFYRYNYIFSFSNSKIDMKKIFESKFGFKYEDIYIPVIILYFFFSVKIPNQYINKILFYYIKKYRNVLDSFIITRENFIQYQSSKLPRGLNSYYYCFKYIYPNPIIEFKGQLYIPLPHLLVDAATESLFTKLTWGNDRLREIIGKEVLQNYLYYILSQSNLYDDVITEFTYYKDKNRYDTPDVIIRKGEICTLFDSKSSVPRINLRDFDEKSITKTINQYAENIVQLYHRIQDFNCFNPFNEVAFDTANIFGVVVLLEDSYISRRKVYDEARIILNFEHDSREFIYLQSNIKIIELKDIEDVTFSGNDYLKCLAFQRDNPDKWNDITFYNSQIINNKDKTNLKVPITDFLNSYQNIINDSIQELYDNGIIPQNFQEN